MVRQFRGRRLGRGWGRRSGGGCGWCELLWGPGWMLQNMLHLSPAEPDE